MVTGELSPLASPVGTEGDPRGLEFVRHQQPWHLMLLTKHVQNITKATKHMRDNKRRRGLLVVFYRTKIPPNALKTDKLFK